MVTILHFHKLQLDRRLYRRGNWHFSTGSTLRSGGSKVAEYGIVGFLPTTAELILRISDYTEEDDDNTSMSIIYT